MIGMLQDAYKGVNNHFNPTSNQIDSYLRVHDRNGDGIVTIEDLEKTVAKYLCSLDDDYGFNTATYVPAHTHTHQVHSIPTHVHSYMPERSPYTGSHVHKTFVRQETEKEQLVKKITRTFSKEIVDAELQHAQKVFEKYDLNRDGF